MALKGKKRVVKETTKPKKRWSAPTSETVQRVFLKLCQNYPDVQTELTYKNPFELLVAVVLSAQCTDARVNLTTPHLFKAYPTPERLAAAKPEDVERLIFACGFYRAKTRSIIKASADLVERFQSKVPKTLDELVTLAGVGRKTASVVLNQAYDLPAIAVDTHDKRVALRLGWTPHEDPVKVETDLCALLPPVQWATVNGMLILHGRRVCKARKPLCEDCLVADDCRFYQMTRKTKEPARKT